MLKCIDIKSILIFGVGFIVIGQVCEFDYFGVQVCKVLCEEGYCVILVNFNFVIIMIDLVMVDVIYIELIKWVIVVKIIEKECFDVLLLIMGGQIVLNCVLDLECYGVLEKFGVEMIGVNVDIIDKVEDCLCFDKVMKDIGLVCLCLGIVYSMEEVYGVFEQVGFFCIICLFFIMGGIGGGIVYNCEEFEEICVCGFDLLLINELLIDELLIGWKEYEMEVVCDKKDNCIIVCFIENFDLMGVYIGDLIIVVLVQILIDKEYQIMCNVLLVVLCEIGVEIGGFNVQFGICLNIGCMVVIEMNLWVFCFLVLVFKVIGFLIVKIVVKLVVGYIFDELQNDIIGGCILVLFELVIDYVVIKILCFVFEKFLKVDVCLIIQMKLVGEVMVIGWIFQELVQKVLCGLEVGVIGFDLKFDLNDLEVDSIFKCELIVFSVECVWYVVDVFCVGKSVEEVFELICIDEWFLVQIEDLVKDEEKVKIFGLFFIDCELMYKFKCKGFFDVCLVKLLGVIEKNLCSYCYKLKVLLVYKCVDICVVEFVIDIVYMYLIYEEECEVNLLSCEKIMIFGGGLNCIGQGIEFDYCCVYVVLVMCEDGYEIIMVNCNLEIVFIDYDIFDCLYFELVIFEDVFEIVCVEQFKGVIVQYGGQILLKFCCVFEEVGVLIIGISLDVIDCVEDCECFQQMVQCLNLCQLVNVIVCSEDEVLVVFKVIGYLLVVCLFYVLGGWVMEIVYQEEEFKCYMCEVVQVFNDSLVLFDYFFNCVIEVDIDVVCDGEIVVIGVIMQYIEQVGVYFGDFVCLLLLYLLLQYIQDEICEQVKKMVLEFGVVGLMNVQMVV